MRKHRRLFEFSEESRVEGYSEEGENASGIGVPEPTELDTLLEKIREREKSAEDMSDPLRNKRKAKDEKGKATAKEIRQAALQTMAKKLVMIVARDQRKLN